MKSFFVYALAVVVVYSCSNSKKEDNKAGRTTPIDSTLLTDTSWGPVTKKTDYTELQKIYGASNVINETICGPECVDSVDATVVYPNDDRAFYVYWQDSFYHKKIAFIEAGGELLPYHTANSLRTGSTLEELLKVNGKKINFAGFGWDYGGYVHSYNGGALDGSPIQFRLDLGDTQPASDSLWGDTELNTDMPVVKKYLSTIVVSSISHRLEK